MVGEPGTRPRPANSRLRLGAVCGLLFSLVIELPAASQARAFAKEPDAKAAAQAAAGELVINGNVVDRESKRPIASFRVIPGTHPRPKEWHWQRRQSAVGVDGQYRICEAIAGSVHVIRIEADGYQPAVSRDFKVGEGNVAINFELTKGENVDGVILTPAGQPAGKAKVAVGIAGSAIAIRNGDIVNLNADLQQADARGHFHFPPQLPGYYLVITHPSGYAMYQPAPHSNHRTTLDPWTRVEGTFRVAGKPKANVPMWIYRNDARSGDDVPYISTTWDEKTDPDGHVRFRTSGRRQRADWSSSRGL